MNEEEKKQLSEIDSLIDNIAYENNSLALSNKRLVQKQGHQLKKIEQEDLEKVQESQ